VQVLIDPADTDALLALLRDRHWVAPGARLSEVARAGDGNMNLVLRLRLAGDARRSLILKQARPWVEKYPDIAAPPLRLAVETDFYRLAETLPDVAAGMPALLAYDPDINVALFEDLGEARDFTALYAGARLHDADRDALLSWLAALHGAEPDPATWPRLANREMRALNHAHIFALPLDPEQGPDVDAVCPGLGSLAHSYRSDDALRARLSALGDRYLTDGPRLLHGDFYPGSWLATDAGPRVIDPEFGFFGDAEFDLGVLKAHLLFAGLDAPDLDAYGDRARVEAALTNAYCGAELLRRLLGVAQLPLSADLEQRRAWLEQGRAQILRWSP
jgi:5-methylthioribose kinase